MPFKASVITDWPTLCSISSEWNDLLGRSASDTVFLTWEWVSAWYESVAPNAQLLTVIVRDDAGKLVAIGPFYLTRMRLLGVLPFRVCRVLGDCYSGSEYPDVITDRANEGEALEAVMKALLDRRELWDCIWMPKVAGWTGGHERMTTCCRNLGLMFHCRRHDFSLVHLPASYDEYLQSLPKKRRALIRQRTKALLDGSGASFEKCCAEEDVETYLGALFHLHQKRWRGRGEEGSFVRKPLMAAFYRTFARLALSRGWLRLFALKIGGEFKAIQIGYAYGDTFSALQEGFDPDGPSEVGNVLRAMAVQSLIEERVQWYDFLGGFTEHKRLWRATERNGADLFIGHPNLKNRLLFYKEVWPFGRFLIEDHPAERHQR